MLDLCFLSVVIYSKPKRGEEVTKKMKSEKSITIKTHTGRAFTFDVMNANTKRAREMVERYKTQNKGGVNDFYKNPSANKTRAEVFIVDFMRDCHGYGYHVTGGSSHAFSAGWLFDHDSKTYLRYETANNYYVIEYNATRGDK